jgi:homoserine acetyltransferase
VSPPIILSILLAEREKREGGRERRKEKPTLPFPWLHSFRSAPSHLPTQTDPENMLTMLHTWQTGDVSRQEPYKGDFSAAMKGIKAKTLVLPSKTDLYFREFCIFCSFFFLWWSGTVHGKEKGTKRRMEPFV